MAVAKDATGTPQTGSLDAFGSKTWTSVLTVGASASFLIVAWDVDTTNAYGTITFTWGGTAMTQIGSLVQLGSGTVMSLGLWGLVSPASGSQSIVTKGASISGGPATNLCAMSFTGSDTSSVAAATYANATNSSSVNVANATVTSGAAIASGDMAFTTYNNALGFTDAFTSGTNPGDGGTAIGKEETGNTNMAAEYYSGAGSTIASSAAQALNCTFVAAIVGIKAAGGGGLTGSQPLIMMRKAMTGWRRQRSGILTPAWSMRKAA